MFSILTIDTLSNSYHININPPSKLVTFTSGIPQGSVIGPTPFVAFINDLDDAVKIVDGFVSKLANDT